MIPSKTVIATSSGVTATGVVTFILTVVQALEGHPTNGGTLASGVGMSLLGLLSLLSHYHKGANLMANQQDLNSLLSRLRDGFTKIVGSPTAKTVELDISEGIKLAEEIEAYAVSATAAASDSTPPPSSAAPSADASATPPAAPGTDFSKLV